MLNSRPSLRFEIIVGAVNRQFSKHTELTASGSSIFLVVIVEFSIFKFMSSRPVRNNVSSSNTLSVRLISIKTELLITFNGFTPQELKITTTS